MLHPVLSTEVDDALAAGADQVQGINFEISNPAPLEQKARAKAYRQAHDRAEQLATLAGVALGNVLMDGAADATADEVRDLLRRELSAVSDEAIAGYPGSADAIEAAAWRDRFRAAREAKDGRGIAIATLALAERDPTTFREREFTAPLAALATRMAFEGDPRTRHLIADISAAPGAGGRARSPAGSRSARWSPPPSPA